MKPIIGNPTGPTITATFDFWHTVRFDKDGKRILADDAVIPYLNKYFNLLTPATCLRVE